MRSSENYKDTTKMTNRNETTGTYTGDKQVRECAAAKNIAAHLIFKKRNAGRDTIVATVHFSYGKSGRVRCDVWDGQSHTLSHQGVAGGYGYDKKTASMIGAVIDGEMMYDHCGQQLRPPVPLEVFPRNYSVPQGYHLANWNQGKYGYGNCFRYAGLDFFRHHEDYWVEDVI